LASFDLLEPGTARLRALIIQRTVGVGGFDGVP
jgi:hypothetical protein